MTMDDSRKKQLAVSNIAGNTKHVSISGFLIPVSQNCACASKQDIIIYNSDHFSESFSDWCKSCC